MILAIMTTYNEVDLMPLNVRWCKDNGLDLYVIDNMSTDGTWEWLKENDIPSHQLDTKGAFHLDWLQSEIVKTIHAISPEWVVYKGADLFFYLGGKVNEILDKLDYDVVRCPVVTMYEKPYICHVGQNVQLIHRYDKDFTYQGDDVIFTQRTPLIVDMGMCINFGGTKSVDQREQTYQRRKKAWELGLNPNFGNHYKKGHDDGWKRPQTLDLSTHKLFRYYEDIF